MPPLGRSLQSPVTRSTGRSPGGFRGSVASLPFDSWDVPRYDPSVGRARSQHSRHRRQGASVSKVGGPVIEAMDNTDLSDRRNLPVLCWCNQHELPSTFTDGMIVRGSATSTLLVPTISLLPSTTIPHRSVRHSRRHARSFDRAVKSVHYPRPMR